MHLIEKSTTLKEPLDASILQSMQEGAPQALTGVPSRPAQINDAIPRVPPKWLKHDRQVRESLTMQAGRQAQKSVPRQL